MDDFGEALVGALPENASDRHFDRFYFNLHGASTAPLVMLGAGVYPGKNVVDGFVVLVEPDRQRNLRFSTELTGKQPGSVGPLTWSTVEPMERWRLTVGENPLGVTLDVTWHKRTPAWFDTVR